MDDGRRDEGTAAQRPQGQRLYAAALGRILQHLCDHGPATISALAEIAQVSRPTVQRALTELEQLGLAAEADPLAVPMGRPARTWGTAPAEQLVLAIDVRRGESAVQLRRLTGPLLVDETLDHEPLRTRAAGDAFAPGLLRAIGEVLDRHGIDRAQILETAIGVSGIVDDDGTVLVSIHLPELTGVPLAALAASTIGLASVQVENDMNLRALGELRTGAARGLGTFLYLTNHQFHRPAVVIDGRPWHGAHRGVGEGDVLSATGVLPATLTHGGRTERYFDVARLIDDGDLPEDWVPVLHERLAAVIAVLSYALDPEAVLVHGGPLTTSPAALADLEQQVAGLLRAPGSPRVLAASPGEDHTIVGALSIALRQALGRVLQVEDPPLPDLH